jgi:hypothetical protein
MSYTLLGNVINDDDITANLANYAYLGWDCSINDAGDKMVVAAMEQNNGNLGRGHIFAFQYSGGSWSSYGDELRGPADSVGSANQCMTHSVKMNGDGTIFISGHPLHDRGTTQSQRNDREGAVMIKQYNSETDTWDARGPAILTTLPLLENGDGNDFTVDRFGEMVDISGDGTTIVVGARYSDYGGGNRGAVLTYKYKIPSGDEWSAGTNLVFKDGDSSQVSDKYYWVLIGNASTNASSGGQTAGNGISLVGESNNDLLGHSVSISYDGTRIAVGIMGEDDGGTDRGMIRIFDYNSGTDKWEQVGQDIKGDNNNDTIGYRVALNKSSDSSIDGSRFTFTTRHGGYVKVYEYNSGTSQWDMMGSNSVWDSSNTTRGKFSISTNGSSIGFSSLNEDGSIVAIGNDDDNTVNVYKWDGSANWTLVGLQLNSSNYSSISSGDGFGTGGQLSAKGDYLVVGSRYVDVGGTDAGQVAVYYNPSLSPATGNYKLLGSVINDDSVSADLGTDDKMSLVSINGNGNKIVISAIQDSGLGYMFSFQYSGGKWSKVGDELRGPRSTNNNNTCEVSNIDINDDGTIFIAGHSNYDVGSATSNLAQREGAVTVWEYNSGTDTWDPKGWTKGASVDSPLICADSQCDQFGENIGINGDGSRIIVGARYYDRSGEGNFDNVGAIFTYEYNSGTSSWDLIGEQSYNDGSTNSSAQAPSNVSIIGTNSGDLLGMDCDINYNGDKIACASYEISLIRVYSYNSGTDKWEQYGNDISRTSSHRFGYHIKMNKAGNRVAGLTREGNYAAVYEYNTGNSQWELMGTDTTWIYGGGGGLLPIHTLDAFTLRDICLNEAGDIVTISNSNNNAVNIFKWNGSNAWTKIANTLSHITLSNVSLNDGLGSCVSLSKYGDYLAVGSAFSDHGGTNTGEISVYYNSDLSTNTSDITTSSVETASVSTTLKNEIVTDLNSISGVSIDANDISASLTIVSIQNNVDYEFTVTINGVNLSDLSGAEQTSLINVIKSRYATDLSIDSSRFTITLREGSIEADVEIASGGGGDYTGGRLTVRLTGVITSKGSGIYTVK